MFALKHAQNEWITHFCYTRFFFIYFCLISIYSSRGCFLTLSLVVMLSKIKKDTLRISNYTTWEQGFHYYSLWRVPRKAWLTLYHLKELLRLLRRALDQIASPLRLPQGAKLFCRVHPCMERSFRKGREKIGLRKLG